MREEAALRNVSLPARRRTACLDNCVRVRPDRRERKLKPCAANRSSPLESLGRFYSATSSPELPNSAGKSLLRQAVSHRQDRLRVVDVNSRHKRQCWNRRGEYVDKADRRMIGHQVAAAFRAIFALAQIRLLKGRNMLGSGRDPHRLGAPEAEGVHGPSGPGTAGAAMTVAHGRR